MPHSQCVYCLKYVNTHLHAKKKNEERRVRAALLFELSQTHTFSSQEPTQWLFCCVRCGAPLVDVNAFDDTRCALMPFFCFLFFLSFKLIPLSTVVNPIPNHHKNRQIRYFYRILHHMHAKSQRFFTSFCWCFHPYSDFFFQRISGEKHSNIPKLWHVSRMESSRVYANIRILREFLCIGVEFAAMLEIGLTCGKTTLFSFFSQFWMLTFQPIAPFLPGSIWKKNHFKNIGCLLFFFEGAAFVAALENPIILTFNPISAELRFHSIQWQNLSFKCNIIETSGWQRIVISSLSMCVFFLYSFHLKILVKILALSLSFWEKCRLIAELISLFFYY